MISQLLHTCVYYSMQTLMPSEISSTVDTDDSFGLFAALTSSESQ